MIIWTDLLNKLATAASRAFPGEGDDTLQTSREMFLNLDPVHPLYGGISVAGTAGDNSACTEANAVVTNGAANNSTVMSLTKGLWDINITVGYAANYTTTGQTPDLSILIGPPSGSSTTRLFAFYATGRGYTPAVWRGRFLFTANGFTIQFTLSANGVGETHRCSVATYAARVL